MRIIPRGKEIELALARKRQELRAIPSQAYYHFKGVTPIDKGGARNNTKLANDTIIADYPYATRLNQGYSRQASRGMSIPTIEFIRKIVKRILGR